jgi:hypothetical protein
MQVLWVKKLLLRGFLVPELYKKYGFTKIFNFRFYLRLALANFALLIIAVVRLHGML